MISLAHRIAAVFLQPKPDVDPCKHPGVSPMLQGQLVDDLCPVLLIAIDPTRYKQDEKS